MRLDALAGNAALKEQLSAQEKGRGLSHAYLISGPAGSGKRTLARLLAAAMVCTGAGEKPCGGCAACRKVFGGIHPDVIQVGADGKDISVGQAREARSDAYIRPNEGERKVYLFHNAQDMTPAAQNALLKLLEEGPAYSAFLLLARSIGLDGHLVAGQTGRRRARLRRPPLTNRTTGSENVSFSLPVFLRNFNRKNEPRAGPRRI